MQEDFARIRGAESGRDQLANAANAYAGRLVLQQGNISTAEYILFAPHL
jgi:hypothetical protein